jgi:hypothetical protein
VTALHGVIDGSITAFEVEGERTYHEMQIAEVDIRHDAALLTSTDFEGEPTEGFEKGDSTELVHGAIVVVGGFPEAVPAIDTKDLIVGMPPMEQLESLIPAGKKHAMLARKSPAVDINVIHLSSTTAPGDSGGPIWNAAGQVVCIANGGIPGADISWAIPLDGIKWAMFQETDIQDLIARGDDGLLAYQTEAPKDVKALIESALSASSDLSGFIGRDPRGFRSRVLQPPQLVKLYLSVLNDVKIHPDDPSVQSQLYSQKLNLSNMSAGLPYIFEYTAKLQKLREGLDALSSADSLESSDKMLLDNQIVEIGRLEQNSVAVASVLTNPEPEAVETQVGSFKASFTDMPINVLQANWQLLNQMSARY